MTQPPAQPSPEQLAAQKRAEEQYEKLIAEVQARIESDQRKTMEAAQSATALEAAHKEKLELAKRQEALENRLKELESCAGNQRAEAEKAQRAEAEETLRRARILAAARVPEKRVEEEAKRLAGLGRPAVDELLRSTPAPTADSLASAFVRGETQVKTEGHIAAIRGESEDGDAVRGYGVVDWSHYKSPGPKGVLA